MPRSFSSGALSIWSNAMYLFDGFAFARTLVMAAVRVVLPWSMCPMVPTFTCGFVLSNFFFAMLYLILHQCSVQTDVRQGLQRCDGTYFDNVRRGVIHHALPNNVRAYFMTPLRSSPVGLFPGF